MTEGVLPLTMIPTWHLLFHNIPTTQLSKTSWSAKMVKKESQGFEADWNSVPDKVRQTFISVSPIFLFLLLPPLLLVLLIVFFVAQTS